MDLASSMLLLGATAILGVLGFLLARNQTKQDAEIKDMKEEQAQTNALLFKKHDEDAAALQKLQREVDKEYYPKSELDAKFKEMIDAIKELGQEFKVLSNRLFDHMQIEERKLK